MPKAKKSMKLRDQKPQKDPRGGVGSHSRNTAGFQGGTNKNQKHHHGGHSHF